ncbi:unnamed protein product [Caenorhabditis bovis]|uniref:Uncharacterized protein n=1 Tax=Caenorhabditis bovis TaxID=2654633 RepID=A0A8S1F286_9PELO|nr:unnamed protein product [Caenorhabditis bovis]
MIHPPRFLFPIASRLYLVFSPRNEYCSGVTSTWHSATYPIECNTKNNNNNIKKNNNEKRKDEREDDKMAGCVGEENEKKKNKKKQLLVGFPPPRELEQLSASGGIIHTGVAMPTKLDIVGNLTATASFDDEEPGDVTVCFVLPSPSSFTKLTILDSDVDESGVNVPEACSQHVQRQRIVAKVP